MYRKFDVDYKIIGISEKLFHYSTKGYIKDSSEDFIVKEQGIKKTREEKGKYSYFTLIKNNWTTMQALNRIAKYCHVSWKRFNFAGTKDKNAITHQLVCVKGVGEETLRKIKIKDIKIEDIFQSNELLRIGELEGNNFTVRINDYNCKNIKHVLELLASF